MDAAGPSSAGRSEGSSLDTSLTWPVIRLAWKLSRRRWERQSPLLGGVAILLTVIGIGSAVAAFALALFVGTVFLPDTEPFTLLIVWDVVIAVFLIMWIAGLLVQLQLGGESLVLEKLLHMPTSPLERFPDELHGIPDADLARRLPQPPCWG